MTGGGEPAANAAGLAGVLGRDGLNECESIPAERERVRYALDCIQAQRVDVTHIYPAPGGLAVASPLLAAVAWHGVSRASR
jgi:hypothetical protein